MTQESSTLKSEEQWDAALYNQRHAFVFEYVRDLVALLKPQTGERILDLACGTGQLTPAFAAAGARVTAIDSSPAMIAAARAQYPALAFVAADARDFSFPDKFDAVFSNAVLHWILEPARVVR